MKKETLISLKGNLKGMRKSFETIRKSYKDESILTIKDVLLECADYEIAWDVDMYPVFVIYDGGRHPENANVWSNVECVHMKEGKIYIDTEDAVYININDCSAEECGEIAEMCLMYYNNEYELDKLVKEIKEEM